jgi:uncharacterized protein (TIGR00290 family)
MEKKSLCSWSGGKDSCYAMIKASEQGFKTKVLLNMLNEEGKISRSHGIPSQILMAQADAAGLPIHLTSSSWKDYEKNFTSALITLMDKYELGYAIFGDIDLQAHRDWEEKVCATSGLEAVLPIWQMDRRQLVLDMLDTGIKTMIVSCNEKMGQDFIGRVITKEIIEEFEAIGIDPCGENGEYHTLVLDCPLFSEEIQVQLLDTQWHQQYWFAKLSLQQKR